MEYPESHPERRGDGLDPKRLSSSDREAERNGRFQKRPSLRRYLAVRTEEIEGGTNQEWLRKFSQTAVVGERRRCNSNFGRKTLTGRSKDSPGPKGLPGAVNPRTGSGIDTVIE